jgi:tetratricopeptide (TPR) repeat protein
MCYPDWWWWILLIGMMASGVAGGLVRYEWDKFDGGPDRSRFSYVVLGVGAALMVPLFLNTISSTIIQESRNDHNKVYILIGFCLAASIFAKQFMGSVSSKALELSKEAKKIATEARQSAHSAEKDAKSADNRAIAVYHVLRLIENEDYDGALAELDQILSNDAENSEGWAWKAFCLKRKEKYKEAVIAIQKALAIENKEVYPWLYNLACYQCLEGMATSEILGSLQRAQLAASKEQLKSLRSDLLAETDFDRIKQSPKFLAFIEELERS